MKHLVVVGRVQQDVAFSGGRVVLRVAAGPVVTHRVGVDAAIAAVRAVCDGLVALLHRLQSLFGVLHVVDLVKLKVVKSFLAKAMEGPLFICFIIIDLEGQHVFLCKSFFEF